MTIEFRAMIVLREIDALLDGKVDVAIYPHELIIDRSIEGLSDLMASLGLLWLAEMIEFKADRRIRLTTTGREAVQAKTEELKLYLEQHPEKLADSTSEEVH